MRWIVLAAGAVFVGRWLLGRLWRVFLQPTGEATPPIRTSDVQPGMRRLIVSDLHLGAGDRLDDFSSDDALFAFVTSYALADEPTELILAGDTFEFLQVRLPDISDNEWSPRAAAARLSVILTAHARSIDALRQFLARPNNQLTLLIGNHDFELHYEAAKDVLRAALGVSGTAQRLRFGLCYDGDGVYVEHGNQYDAWNRFLHFEGISYPFEVVRGTWIVKDIINPLEDDPLDIAPLLDNVKPTRAFLWYLLSLPRLRHAASRRYVARALLRVLRAATLPRNLRHQVLRISQKLDDSGSTAKHPTTTQAANEADAQMYDVPGVLAEFQEAVQRFLRRGRPASGEAALDQIGEEAERQLRREMRGFKHSFARAMAQIAASADYGHDTVFACGHTHLAQVVQLNERQTYYNTGTWTMVVRDVATADGEQLQFPFLEVRYANPGTPPQAELLVWVGHDAPPQHWRKADEVETRR